MHLIKPLFIILGTLSLLVGIVGIIVPGLPTTPFLLLTAALYLKSSNRLYNKVISNKWIGSYILQYQKNKGMSYRQKFWAISTMCLMITISCLFYLKSFPVILSIIALGIIGAVVMAFVVPTIKQKPNI